MKDLFKIEKKPKKGLFWLEWVMIGYLVLTLLMVFFTYTKVANPEAMIWGRVRIMVVTLALWGVYRMVPCRFTRFCRITVQMALLSWWYPDTYELNRMLPNLDHVFAQAEQSLFGFQPALIFHEAMPWSVVSELLDMGYAAYYPMIALAAIYYFIWRYKEYERCAFVIMASFFAYYVIFVLVPVTGPTFYFKAVGIDQITAGVFPNLGDYFNTHTECLPSPGYTDGIFYQLVEDAKAAGERPTAAFPSSHVGISTVIMLLIWHTRNRKLLYIMAPFYVLLCFATVYIQAHYAIDAIAGLITGTMFYFIFMWMSKGMKN
ncbi:phosphatase PAP2 family protein [Prevotella pectinovora]|uniref:phosphatase PAP2 family protein n=1 Tax=Prevotella pectinovora TaxID=1602169 RepID=UPI003A918AA1